MADTNYLRLIEHAKQDLWSRNPHLTDEQRESLWTSTLSSINNTKSNVSPTFNTQHTTRLDQVPRSMSSTIPFHSTNADMAQFSQLGLSSMDRTTSAPAAIAMGRNLSTSISPVVWTQFDNQTSEYTHYPLSASHSPLGLQSIHEVPGLDSDYTVEYTPAEFISTFPSQSLSPSSTSARLQVAQLTPDSQWSTYFDGSLSPNTPTAPVTPVTISDSNMARQSSFHPTVFHDISMLRVHSDSSNVNVNVMPIASGDMCQFPFLDPTISGCVDTSSLSFSFTASPGESFSSPTCPSSVSPLDHNQQQLDLAEDMQRSASTSNDSDASHVSSSSNSSRQVRREREINMSASRKIAPRAIQPSDETRSASSNIEMKRLVSQDGSSRDVAPITKMPYTRPQHPKMHCNQCNERPNGFRGTHELERHIARKHAPSRKAFICIDASENKKFLAGCKHCRNGKKYGAYYNAAAHLRRAHFHPREKGRKAKGDKKRGGIGGGDDPPMDFLKQHWIKEVEVREEPSTTRRSSSAELSDSTEYNHQEEAEFDFDCMDDNTYLAPQVMDMSSVEFDPSTFVNPNDAFYPYGVQNTELVNFDLNVFQQQH